MVSAVRHYCLTVGIACYIGFSAGAPLYIHVSLAHHGHCHRGCESSSGQTAGLRSQQQTESASVDPAECPVCSHLIKTASAPGMVVPIVGSTVEPHPIQGQTPVHLLCDAAALLSAAGPRAPPFC